MTSGSVMHSRESLHCCTFLSEWWSWWGFVFIQIQYKLNTSRTVSSVFILARKNYFIYVSYHNIQYYAQPTCTPTGFHSLSKLTTPYKASFKLVFPLENPLINGKREAMLHFYSCTYRMFEKKCSFLSFIFLPVIKDRKSSNTSFYRSFIYLIFWHKFPVKSNINRGNGNVLERNAPFKHTVL